MPRRDYLGIARNLSLAIALVAFAVLCVSGPGTKSGWWGWQAGLGMLRWSFWLGAIGAVLALCVIVLLAFPRFRIRAWVPVAALLLALVAMAPPALLLAKAKAAPRIHDVTTDMADPPAFVALLETRKKAPNGFAYGGEAVATQQRLGYPDLKPLVVKTGPRDTMQKAIDAARSMGWEVVASDAAAGRIEATDTTSWFGFKDDVVVRIRPEGEGSRVDIRSVSRVGLSDIGANAKRIRSFLDKLS
jgi:uncharacterized protein (DUF1499 family)